MQKLLNGGWIAGALFVAALPCLGADQRVEPKMPEAFAPIRWGMTEAEIRQTFRDFNVAESPLKGTIVDEQGNRVPGKGVIIEVREYPAFGGTLKSNVYFLRRGDYQSIEISPGKGWAACEEIGQLISEDKAQCKKEFNEFVALRKRVFHWLNRALPVKGRRVPKKELDDPNELGELWVWRTGGLQYVFNWYRAEVSYTFSVKVLKDSRNKKSKGHLDQVLAGAQGAR